MSIKSHKKTMFFKNYPKSLIMPPKSVFVIPVVLRHLVLLSSHQVTGFRASHLVLFC